MILLYQIDRHQDGSAKIVPPEGGELPSEKQVFFRYCYLNCVTDVSKMENLWEVENARRKKAREAFGKKSRQPRVIHDAR